MRTWALQVHFNLLCCRLSLTHQFALWYRKYLSVRTKLHTANTSAEHCALLLITDVHDIYIKIKSTETSAQLIEHFSKINVNFSRKKQLHYVNKYGWSQISSPLNTLMGCYRTLNQLQLSELLESQTKLTKTKLLDKPTGRGSFFFEEN